MDHQKMGAIMVPDRKNTSELGREKVREHIPENLSIQDMVEFINTNVETWKEIMTYYRCAIKEVQTKFEVLNEEFSLSYDRNPIETVKSRLKSPRSLAEKLIRKQLPLNIESVENNIFDMAGVRVICSFVDDIYMLADSLIRQDDVFLLERKDYIENPKPSGYRGLHLVIETPIFLHNHKRMMKVEVQLRTIAMDFWASLEHKLRYKKNLDPALSAQIEDRLLRCSETVFELDMDMQRIKGQIDGSAMTED